MAKKGKQPLNGNEEKVLNFDVAKDMTVGEAVKKHKEIQAGITTDDGVLDRYIKQHRQEIEAKKQEIQTLDLIGLGKLGQSDTEQVQEPLVTSEEVEQVQEPLVTSEEIEQFPAAEEIEEVKEEVGTAVDASLFNTPDEEDIEEKNPRKKKELVWVGLAILFVAVLSGIFILMTGTNKNQSGTDSSTSTSQTTSASSSSAEDENLTAFNTLYATFFVDAEQTKLKNSQFDKLSELKAILDKMDSNGEAYKTAKAKYDTLEKAIKAIQTLNSQFDKELIVDGELDTTATVKSDASLTATTTGLSGVDSLLASAVTFGQSQQTTATAQVAADTSGGTATAAPSTSGTTTAVTGGTSSVVAGDNPLYGIAVPAGVTLQRNLSRVPYDQSKIDDVNNPAWVFGEGVLEKIITISQQRGYVTGNNYILEKVNIINGNGYYNLFKPDGTYLFSLNCKTGYFVGNGAGHSDALDY
ncbi:TPA: cell division site-positioning protein MapZ family protein [Streptococcus suis]